MDHEKLRGLLEEFKNGNLSLDDVLISFKQLPYEAVQNFAKVDHHRAMRTGFPEVIFGEGKTPEQIAEIFKRLSDQNPQVMATRVNADVYSQLHSMLPDAVYHSSARILYIDRQAYDLKKPGILVISAGTTDIPVAEEAALTAEIMGNQVERIFDVGVAGLHRLFSHLTPLQNARVVIVAAGMEGALPSVVGGLVTAPVIAIPTSFGYGASLHGFAALLGMLNSCANGVAVVNIDNGFGAGCLAAKINRLSASEG